MKKSLFPLALVTVLTTSHLSSSPLSDWFAKSEGDRGAIPAEALKGDLNSAEAIAEARNHVWKAYREGAIKNGWDSGIPAQDRSWKEWFKGGKIDGLIADVGDKKMPYVVLVKGEKPEGGWPVFITLHGGGGNPHADGPHTWTVNTREWLTQMQLTTKLWESPGIYIIPRMADDRDGRWYYGYNQIFIDRLIQQAILFKDANPDRVYLQGISEGGYAAFRLGSMMADRWAGSCAMAAAEPIGNAPVENLQHVAFRCGIGENDRMFNRIGLARTYFERLDELEKENPGDFKHFFDEQVNRGHGIDYKEGPAWITKHSRTAVPKAFHWTVIKQHDRHRGRLYWLALEQSHSKLPLKLTAKANRESNTVEISSQFSKDGKDTASENIGLRVYLNDTLVDLSKEVTIKVNGKKAFQGIAKPSMEALIRSTAERGDPKLVFPAMVVIK
ncbi:hypothetical protein NT6N_13780 [Oceaniferula spumae]|uniref:Peptidase S9 prolyl oligopeptidase catalytic domain-containing protein n=1 Tax=Oceaniferula spumae TaxID=2979115 RepID=A0AAT9FJY8_9BACT